jgi:signal transduction histidine kinase
MTDAATPLQRFISSMSIDYEKWHDGIGYDLDALAEIKEHGGADLQTVEQMLCARAMQDWRDVEALVALDTPRARAAIHQALESGDRVTRVHAAEALHQAREMSDEHLAQFLSRELREPDLEILIGFSQLLDLVEHHPSQRVRDALLWCAKNRTGIAAHCAAMLYYHAGIAKEAFGWEYRPLFLRFNQDNDLADRQRAFKELCAALKVDPRSVP